MTEVLGYAPPARSRARWAGVILLGCLTTALSVGGTAYVDHSSKGDFYIFGLLAWGIVPIGALMVGFAAASGYVLGAWFSGCRIRRSLMGVILAITLLAYVAMHYVEYRLRAPAMGFAGYYDAMTRSMRFESTMNPRKPRMPFGPQEEEDDSLGYLGYGVRLLEIAAFSTGALCAPLFLRKKRYCDLCQRYYKTRCLAVMPASMPIKRKLGVFTPPSVSLGGEHVLRAEEAGAKVKELGRLLMAGEISTFNDRITEMKAGSRAARKLPRHVELLLSYCPQCRQGIFHPTFVTGLDRRSAIRQEHGAIRLNANETRSIRLS
jgi:hypothetical protein